VISAAALLLQTANAENGQDLSRMYGTQWEGYAENYMRGLADGFEMREALRMKPSRYEYCKPYSVKMEADDYRALLDAQLKDPAKQEYITHLPAYLVLLIGMNEKFPCSK